MNMLSKTFYEEQEIAGLSAVFGLYETLELIRWKGGFSYKMVDGWFCRTDVETGLVFKLPTSSVAYYTGLLR